MTWQLTLVVGICVVLLAAAWMKKRREQAGARPPAVPEPGTDPDTLEDFNEKFLKNFTGGAVVPLVKTYQIEDYMLLRSVLDGTGILTYSEFEQMNALYPGVPISGYSQAYISVAEADVEAARSVVAEYIEERRAGLAQTPRDSVPAKVVRTYLDVNGMRGNLPELLR